MRTSCVLPDSISPETWRPSFSVTTSAKAWIPASTPSCQNGMSKVRFIHPHALRNDTPVHYASFLRARTYIFENQALRLVFTWRQPLLPDFLVVIQLYFHGRQIAENIFRVLRNGAAGALQRPR